MSFFLFLLIINPYKSNWKYLIINYNRLRSHCCQGGGYGFHCSHRYIQWQHYRWGACRGLKWSNFLLLCSCTGPLRRSGAGLTVLLVTSCKEIQRGDHMLLQEARTPTFTKNIFIFNFRAVVQVYLNELDYCQKLICLGNSIQRLKYY